MTRVARFGGHVRRRVPLRGCAVIAAGVLVAAVGQWVPARASTGAGGAGEEASSAPNLPDLVPDVGDAWVDYTRVEFDGQEYSYGSSVLSFDLMTQNLGRRAIDVHVDDPLDTARPKWSQCTAWSTDLVCGQRAPLGGVTWDEGDKHYSFADYAHYELRRLDAENKPDFSDEGLLSSRSKASDCFRDHTRVRDDASPVPRYAVSGVCNPVESGISPGWGDQAASATRNQDVSLDGIGDGRYALVVTIDPDHHFFEARTTNNRLVAIVEITGKDTPFPVATVLSKALM